ncbi:hypothetical protein [Streptomyces sp. NPDC058583]|uniref:hypothetical protein n=1 Tax=unclassified Streptomyces TaxID=2593676 RepID=UPI003663B108
MTRVLGERRFFGTRSNGRSADWIALGALQRLRHGLCVMSKGARGSRTPPPFAPTSSAFRAVSAALHAFGSDARHRTRVATGDYVESPETVGDDGRLLLIVNSRSSGGDFSRFVAFDLLSGGKLW